MSTIKAHDFARPIVVLPTRKAVVRALAAGRTVWCAETGEGWQLGEGWVRASLGFTFPGSSLNCARHVARRIFAEEERKNFFFGSGVK